MAVPVGRMAVPVGRMAVPVGRMAVPIPIDSGRMTFCSVAVQRDDQRILRGLSGRRCCPLLILLGGVVPQARLDQRSVHVQVRQPRAVWRPLGDRRLQKTLVVALWKLRLVVRAARLVAGQRALHDGARQVQHVLELPRERDKLVGPVRAVRDADMLDALHQFLNLRIGRAQAVVVANDGDVLRHRVAQFLMQTVRVFSSRRSRQLLVLFLLSLPRALEHRGGQIAHALGQMLDIIHHARPGELAAG